MSTICKSPCHSVDPGGACEDSFTLTGRVCSLLRLLSTCAMHNVIYLHPLPIPQWRFPWAAAGCKNPFPPVLSTPSLELVQRTGRGRPRS